MKKQGKVKLIPVTKEQVTEGMKILDNGRVGKLLSVFKDSDSLSIQYGDQAGTIHTREFFEDNLNLKKLVVEYETERGISPLNRKVIEQLPLEYSQWQSAINNGEVDSDKVVEFEIIKNQIQQHACEWCEGKGCGACKGSGNSHRTYAKIIPQKKRTYSEEEVHSWIESLHNLSNKELLNGKSYSTGVLEAAELILSKL